jgi:hypothetical protein
MKEVQNIKTQETIQSSGHPLAREQWEVWSCVRVWTGELDAGVAGQEDCAMWYPGLCFCVASEV